MKEKDLKKFVQEIVNYAKSIKDKHTGEADAPVNYACIFAQSQEEFDDLLTTARNLGKVIKETPTGPLFRIEPLRTVSGPLRLLKVRKPDVTRIERGDADFTVSDYPSFKKSVLKKPGFTLIEREEFEMIELMDPGFDVRAYFSHPTLDRQLELPLVEDSNL
ncbi:MAG: hypothetical protein A3F04_00200 [Candidatus Chisholmbacteria bacterium RIFCSPHIGHO2_12_FULL_49_9]|uniref:Uncharacterized protein n=1 Tax=Candidatus Chisholmbacteria bacterium RIFCSPHIGHO2_01_FULL_52_32 TaxID=1797591 RepID=A0A1G1VSD3_9BACT|nr:MAG: hypothetical protein A2786_02040 [Candidatus Chisholmbacteria bacterium RIFCSPHIGHO2_01_FULL_52_32]OGY19136.1 MAG: hypothetical protein A3F04_00200 [Candidatus Chisholmbacteria bacterium RIFCSPHIGHO2_12_FULL_49_9]OGY20347.1 MAG: hypothetical protein A2900_04705 [Candidatus Chisholmbacteria bacterium RIFCSPLOWO2_01_FULL_50_28]